MEDEIFYYLLCMIFHFKLVCATERKKKNIFIELASLNFIIFPLHFQIPK